MKTLEQAGKAVAGVFAAFGGFLLNVQPPEGVLKGFTVGFASAVSALIFLILSALIQRWGRRRYRTLFASLAVLLAAAVIILGLRYQKMFAVLTLDIPASSGSASEARSEKIVIGDANGLTVEARQRLLATHEPLSDLVLDFGGKSKRERVWNRDSLLGAKVQLSNGYLALAITLSAAVFVISEALFPPQRQDG